jgi:hypothetical protein
VIRPSVLLFVGTILADGGHVYAQQLTLDPSTPTHISQTFGKTEQEQAVDSLRFDDGKMIFGGLGLGFAGFLVGGFLGSAVASGCVQEYCQLEGAFYGAAALGTLGMAYGVHLSNDKRGSLPLDFLAGAGAWVTGIAIASAVGWDEEISNVMFVAIPVAQLAVTITVEKATTRSLMRREGLTLLLAPGSDGGFALAASVKY